MTGEIPSELGSLVNLELLELNTNQLTGEIPSELGSLVNLRTLWLNDNQLSGEIPPELGSLSSLEKLVLSYNELTGEIPASLASLANLTLLELAGNQLTGCILGGLRDVEDNDLDELGLPFCTLTETLDCASSVAVPDPENNPDLVFDCEILLAARDTIAGDVTLHWVTHIPIMAWNGVTIGGTPPRVTGISPRRRGLNGTIPTELGSLTSLQVLDLSGNEITGSLRERDYWDNTFRVG